MKLSDIIERLGRTVFEAPFGAASQAIGDSPEAAEIRIALLDEIRNKIQHAGGHALFPYNVVRVHIRASAEEGAVFEHDFFRRFLDEEVRKTLSKEGARFPQDLRVAVKAAVEAGKWLRVEMLIEDAAPIPAAPTPHLQGIATLVVSAGTANRSELALENPRTNLGRLTDVYKSQGPSRRNDLAFAEDTPINRTVSREHAHIVRDKDSGEYRLFNDRWHAHGNQPENNCGLWIVRDGMGQEVHRDGRGTRLMDGDEIHLGKAIVKFQMK
jgi:pSer/pThr/pTyr-binding forkhead associated (FHA) protein